MHMQDSRDHKLLNERLRSGELEAFHVIYKQYFPRLRNYAIRYVYDAEAAQDIVHDAYLKFWEAHSRFDPDRQALPYLLAIVRNSCLNHLKSLRIQDSHQDKIIEALLFADIEDPELDENLKRRLDEVLRQLPEKGYEALMEHVVGRKTVRQIACETGVAESTVKTHIKRAMKLLRKNLMFILVGY